MKSTIFFTTLSLVSALAGVSAFTPIPPTLVLSKRTISTAPGKLAYTKRRSSVVPRTLDMGNKAKRQGCPTGFDICTDGETCCPTGGVCCSGTGTCCDDGFYCTTIQGEPGCCPDGELCDSLENPCLDEDQVQCAGFDFCCDPNLECSVDANGEGSCGGQDPVTGDPEECVDTGYELCPDGLGGIQQFCCPTGYTCTVISGEGWCQPPGGGDPSVRPPTQPTRSNNPNTPTRSSTTSNSDDDEGDDNGTGGLSAAGKVEVGLGAVVGAVILGMGVVGL